MSSEEPLWARILEAYYRQDMAGESFDRYGYQKQSRVAHLAEELEANQSDVRNSLNKLIEMDLLHDLPTGNESKGFSLTKEGFQVAHERNIQETQNNVNRILGYLTLGLLLISSLSAMVSATSNVNNSSEFIIGYDLWPLGVAWIAIIVAISLSFMAYRSDVLRFKA